LNELRSAGQTWEPIHRQAEKTPTALISAANNSREESPNWDDRLEKDEDAKADNPNHISNAAHEEERH
jgi:hypothetical protein